MQKKKWIKTIDKSEVNGEDKRYYKSLTPEERISIVQELREQYTKIKDESTEGLRRVLRIIKSK